MKYLRLLLLPFSFLYGLVVVLRNWFYDAGLFKSKSYNYPVISIGNLDVGGAGKSPMTEYLITLLKGEYKVATLSRGYGRQTKGFILATPQSDATQLGDEPAQFKQKFKDITVAVCEKRAYGIEKLLPDNEVIILDDAYQHRSVTPGLSILLFDYARLKQLQLLLPAGNLREPFAGRRRAQVLIVSKCPASLTVAQQQQAIARLKPYSGQQVYFTAITYKPFQTLSSQQMVEFVPQGSTVFLLTGIANTLPLLQYMNSKGLHVIHHNYPDHHQFSLKNIAKLATDFNNCTAPNKVIITTEKDAQRLNHTQLQQQVLALPILVLPIGVQFLNDGQQPFNQTIIHYVRKYTTHRGLH